jgi:hypothetical protein
MDNKLMMEALHHGREAIKSEETTAYKLGKITSKLINVKRRLQLNAQEQTTFSAEEMMQDVQQALDLLDTIRHPYVS